MFKWIYVMTFILSGTGFFSYGASIEVTSLTHNTCWVQDLYNGQYKLASFNNSTAFDINTAYTNKLNDLLEQTFPEIQIQGRESQDFYLHCSSFGMALVTNVETTQGRFCSWARIEEGKVDLISMGLSEDKEFCHGHKRASLILYVNDLERAREVLSSQKWVDSIEEIEKIAEDVLKITTYKKVAFKLDEVALELLNGSNRDWLKNIDYNYLNHPVGEAILLKSFSDR